MLDFAFRHHFWQHYCLMFVCGVFLTVDLLPRCFTKIRGWPAGTNLAYKVHQIVNISSSGFGSNICSPFSLRPDVLFVCQGRIVSLFLFFSFLFLCLLFTSDIQLVLWHLSKWEERARAMKDPERNVRGFCFVRYLHWRRDVFLCLFLCLAVKTSVELLLPGSWWAYITLCVEESLVNTLKIRMLSHSMWSHDESSGKARLLKAQSDVSQPHISKRVMNQRKEFVQKQMLSVNYLKKNPTTFILWCLIHFLILHSGWSFFLKYESVLVFFLNLFSLVKRSAVGMCMSYRFYLTC